MPYKTDPTYDDLEGALRLLEAAGVSPFDLNAYAEALDCVEEARKEPDTNPKDICDATFDDLDTENCADYGAGVGERVAYFVELLRVNDRWPPLQPVESRHDHQQP